MEPQPLQIGEVAQFRRDGARQSVVVEGQSLQIGEEQVLQIGEVAQCRRDAARQSVASEVQSCHPTTGENDAVPLVHRRCCNPIPWGKCGSP